MCAHKIEILLEPRPYGQEPFASLIVNDRHIWRFESKSQADVAADNLRKALRVDLADKKVGSQR